MKKIYKDPQAELVELDALITTGIDVSGDGGEVGTNADENVTGLYD